MTDCCLQMLQQEGMHQAEAEERVQQVNQDMQAIIGTASPMNKSSMQDMCECSV